MPKKYRTVEVHTKELQEILGTKSFEVEIPDEKMFAVLYSLEYWEEGVKHTIFSESKEKLESLRQAWRDAELHVDRDKIQEHKFNTLSNLVLYTNFVLGSHKTLQMWGIED